MTILKKRFFYSLILLLTGLTLFTSCNGKDKKTDKDNTAKNPEVTTIKIELSPLDELVLEFKAYLIEQLKKKNKLGFKQVDKKNRVEKKFISRRSSQDAEGDTPCIAVFCQTSVQTCTLSIGNRIYTELCLAYGILDEDCADADCMRKLFRKIDLLIDPYINPIINPVTFTKDLTNHELKFDLPNAMEIVSVKVDRPKDSFIENDNGNFKFSPNLDKNSGTLSIELKTPDNQTITTTGGFSIK